DMLLTERLHEPEGFRHRAPEVAVADPPQALRGPQDFARGHDRWVINKLRALNSWYTKGLDNGSHLRVAINAAESIAHLRAIVEDFFMAPDLQVGRVTSSSRLLSRVSTIS